MDIDSLRQHLARRLNDAARGTVLCEVRLEPGDVESDRRRLFGYLRSVLPQDIQGLLPPIQEQDLHPMTRERAVDVASRVMRGLLMPGLPDAHDRAEAEAFVDMFAPRARFYSTYVYEGQYAARGRFLIGPDFEEGILVADDRQIGVLWMGDSD